MINILIADDHALIRSGLRELISGTEDMALAGEAEEFISLGEILEKRTFDVLLLDINMPNGNALDTLRHIKSTYPHMAVLILSVYPENQYAVRMLKSGASGYVTKESAPDELVSAIRKVATGKKYVSPALAEQLAEELESDYEKTRHEVLSNREFQVFIKLAKGEHINDIADALELSDKTVRTYRARILEKMKLKSNSELVTYAFRNNLVD